MKIVKKRFPHKIQVGHCIYCGANDGYLSKEHIVPKGLRGQFVLHKASCSQCRDTTSKIEDDVLHGSLYGPRAKLNLPIKRKRNWLSLTIEREGQQETVNIPTQKLPVILALLSFNRPAHIDKRPYEEGIKTINVGAVPWVLIGTRLLKRLSEQLNADSIIFEITYTGHMLARLLAKIAYGFAVERFGASIMHDAYVLPSLLGQAQDIGHWVGCVDETSAATNNLHEIRLSVKNGNIYAYIRLFAYYPVAPEYLVVVGPIRCLQSDTAEDTLFIC